MQYQYNDGGRSSAGYKGKAGDCVVRAFAIASNLPYDEIYDLVNEIGLKEKTGKRKRGRSNARSGVYKYTIKVQLGVLYGNWYRLQGSFKRRRITKR